ncbi:MAG TPA: FHA domain-containing protein [Planctomycetota bacterium]|nr:FHA domain-containing protein [Planctomycetota bacterium]
MPKLIDERTGEERELIKPVVLIGRAEYCDICVPEPAVSREHARIQRRLTGYYIEDLGSRHGTQVNEVRIRGRVKLCDGDVIAVAAARPEGGPTTSLHVQHTDTVAVARQAAPAGQAAERGPDAARGACFVFRK